ncbi:MAG TPA: enolase C-terminal domain-like protein [Acidobacteriaceae bacterium]|nr:enolase C-terminal domain-like protein [Acidobacteriaceae bacterium]
MEKIHRTSVRAYTIPTDAPEADGTIAWSKTTLVLVQLEAGDVHALGYTYANPATAKVAEVLVKEVIQNSDAWQHPELWMKMQRTVRNLGNRGIAAMAISAIDIALWDLRSKLLNLPLVQFLGAAREFIPAYGSGGFTCYDDRQLQSQLGGWAEQGFAFVKMKIGTHPDDDPRRVRLARHAIGDKVQLFVDANGAYTAKQAIYMAEIFSESNVVWFEEPVSSDDLSGLRLVREKVPAPMEIAAGEYGYTVPYFENMLAARSVDVQQADATRAQGITGFLSAAAVCDAHQIALSAHCAPSIHMHVCCAAPRARHLEFFHDHARIERMLFDGFCNPREGRMFPDLSRPGFGLEWKEKDAEQFLAR